jgi:hypothetical protein
MTAAICESCGRSVVVIVTSAFRIDNKWVGAKSQCVACELRDRNSFSYSGSRNQANTGEQ